MTTQNVRSAHGLKSKERQFLQNTLSAYEKSILQAGFRHGEPITQVLIEIGRLVEDFDARLGAHESHISGHHQLMVACIERARKQIAPPLEPPQEEPKKIANGASPPGLIDEVLMLFWRILRKWQRSLLGGGDYPRSSDGLGSSSFTKPATVQRRGFDTERTVVAST